MADESKGWRPCDRAYHDARLPAGVKLVNDRAYRLRPDGSWTEMTLTEEKLVVEDVRKKQRAYFHPNGGGKR